MILSTLGRSQPAMQCLHFSRLSLSLKFGKNNCVRPRQAVSPTVRLLSGAAFSAALAHRSLRVGIAECGPRTTRVLDGERNLAKGCSALELLLIILKNEMFPLLVALTSALLTAVCHALMPICAEEVIPALKIFLWNGRLPLESVHVPAVRLAALCVAHIACTSVYVASLAVVFRDASARLKQAGSTRRRWEQSSTKP